MGILPLQRMFGVGAGIQGYDVCRIGWYIFGKGKKKRDFQKGPGWPRSSKKKIKTSMPYIDLGAKSMRNMTHSLAFSPLVNFFTDIWLGLFPFQVKGSDESPVPWLLNLPLWVARVRLQGSRLVFSELCMCKWDSLFHPYSESRSFIHVASYLTSHLQLW